MKMKINRVFHSGGGGIIYNCKGKKYSFYGTNLYQVYDTISNNVIWSFSNIEGALLKIANQDSDRYVVLTSIMYKLESLEEGEEKESS